VPSSELTHVRVSGVSGVSGALGDAVGAGAGLGVAMTSGVLGADVLVGVLALPVGVVPVAALVVGAVPAGRGGGVRIAASKRLNASLVSPASASAAPAN
jgi:hypothetical protein